MNNQKRLAFQFIILLGIVSLFGDITYEGARSITGPYLAILGASAGIVGLIAGLGEFIGFALRLVFGYLADRTKAYWVLTFLGYGLIIFIPFLSFANSWQVAGLFIILERMGKAIRSPARDTILSYATKQVGRGFGFGIHELLDQIGAIIGPILFVFVFFLKGTYRDGFGILWVPAILALIFLTIARNKVSLPRMLEEPVITKKESEGKLSKVFWFYILFIFFSVTGFSHFQIISYHIKVRAIAQDLQIPLLFALAMGVDAVVAPIIGKVYDRIGIKSVLAAPLLTLPIPILAFSKDFNLIVTGVILWGLVMGIQETIMRAAIADIAPIERRGFSYGVFNTAYGLAFLLGSAVMGFLYGISYWHLVGFAVTMEIASLFVYYFFKKR